MPTADVVECKIDIDPDMLHDVEETMILRTTIFDENVAELVEILMGHVTLPSGHMSRVGVKKCFTTMK